MCGYSDQQLMVHVSVWPNRGADEPASLTAEVPLSARRKFCVQVADVCACKVMKVVRCVVHLRTLAPYE